MLLAPATVACAFEGGQGWGDVEIGSDRESDGGGRKEEKR